MAVRGPARARWLAAVPGLLIAGFAVSCGGSASTPGGSGTTAPAGPSSSTSASQPAGGSGGASVTATETEFKISLSRTSLPAGKVTFAVKNSGKVPHALAIRGQGVNAATATLEPGQSGHLTVTLRSGTYDVFCPVDGHKGLGMDLEVHAG